MRYNLLQDTFTNVVIKRCTARQELGSLNGIPFYQACGKSSRLNGLFRNLGVLSANPGDRPLGAAACANVLYQAMALVPNESPRVG